MPCKALVQIASKCCKYLDVLFASRGLRDCKDGIVRPEESFAFGGSAPSSVSFSSVHEILPIKFVLSHAVTSLICWISGTRPNGRRSRWNGGDSRVQSWWDAWKSARMTEVLEYWERHWNMMKHDETCVNVLMQYIQISAHPRACGHSLVRTKTQHNAIHLIHSLWHLTGIQSDHFATPCSTKIY